MFLKHNSGKHFILNVAIMRIKNSSTIGFLQVIFAAILWGTLGVFGKTLNSLGVEATSIVTIRIVIAFLGLVVYWLFAKKDFPRIEKRDLPLLLLYTLTSVIAYNLLYFSAISLIPIAVAAILLYLSPIFVLFFSALFLNEKITLLKVAYSFIVFAGISMVLNLGGVSELSTFGVLCGIGAGITFSLYSVFGKKLMKRNNPLEVVTFSFGLGGIGLLFVNSLLFGFKMSYSINVWVLLLILGLIPTLLAFILYNSGLNKIKASEASIVSTLEPVTAAILGSFILSEKLDVMQILGIVIVVLTIIASNVTNKTVSR